MNISTDKQRRESTTTRLVAVPPPSPPVTYISPKRSQAWATILPSSMPHPRYRVEESPRRHNSLWAASARTRHLLSQGVLSQTFPTIRAIRAACRYPSRDAVPADSSFSLPQPFRSFPGGRSSSCMRKIAE